MFKDSPFFSGFSVDDIDAARTFYRDTLGLDVRESRETGLLEIHAGSRVACIVYGKPNHEPATYTVLNLPVSDVEAAVDRLIAAGVAMEHYDSEYLHTDPKGIARENGPTIAWFRDPAGNIISVLEAPAA